MSKRKKKKHHQIRQKNENRQNRITKISNCKANLKSGSPLKRTNVTLLISRTSEMVDQTLFKGS